VGRVGGRSQIGYMAAERDDPKIRRLVLGFNAQCYGVYDRTADPHPRMHEVPVPLVGLTGARNAEAHHPLKFGILSLAKLLI